MSRMKRYALALALAILSPVFLVLTVAAIATFGAVGLWLLLTDKEVSE